MSSGRSSSSSSSLVLNDYLAALVLIFVGLLVVVKKLDGITNELQTLNANIKVLTASN
ncbi:MAG: hypothetical protein M5F18_00675 [Asgard group archaeon]|nr:hypothetical protein JTP64_002174 [Candida tropicalis]MCP8717797.1 hypothetical protein [Asgard group archaeon]